MNRHEDLIEVLRCIGSAICNEAADALEAMEREIEGLHAARRAYASEFPPDNEGEPDVGSIHQNIRAMKAEIEGLRKDAERYRWLRAEHERVDPVCHLNWKLGLLREGTTWVNTARLDESIDAAKGAAK